MPASLPSVPLLEQEIRQSCLAACARMVLAYFGLTLAEEDLRESLRTRPEGTEFGNLAGLASLGAEVRFYSGRALLEYWLEVGVPPIVPLDTEHLGYWPETCPHAAVVVGIDDESIKLNDPAFPDAPRAVPLAEFLRAWEANECVCAVILPPARDG